MKNQDNEKPIEFFYRNGSEPEDEDERRLAVELKRYYDKHGLLPSEIEESKMKAIFARAGLVWVDIGKNKNFLTFWIGALQTIVTTKAF